jgi:hypothetical protein
MGTSEKSALSLRLSFEEKTMFISIDRQCQAVLLLCVAIGAAACSDATTSAAGKPLTVSLTTQAQGAVADRSPLTDITIAAASNSLVVTKAQLVARRIELAPASASACTGVEESGDDDAEVEDGCAEVETGPTLLNIPLNTSTTTSITATVPAGTYRALELRVEPVTSGNRRSMAFVAAHPEFQNASVRIEGTFNGMPFVFTSAIDTRIETAFSTPITVDATNPNVTVAIDLTNWFSDGSGGTLDPSNSANASRISANISNSFHAFEDDDRDGHDDHHR